jgi:CBS domain-containing protein
MIYKSFSMTTSETVSRTVSDFMTRKVKVITENETMRQACKLMYQHNIGSIIIIKNDDDTTKKEIPAGILTERDIARMIGFSAKFYPDTPVSEVMNKPLITVSPNTSVKDAVALMEQRDIRRLPVVNDEQQMIGIITAKDILKAVMNIFKGTTKGQDLTSEGFDLLGLLGAE